jgi:hypothetical protein
MNSVCNSVCNFLLSFSNKKTKEVADNECYTFSQIILFAILFAIPLAGNKICKRNCKRILDGFKTKGG